MSSKKIKIVKDLFIVFLSVLLAIFLVKTGFLDKILLNLKEFKILSSFLAGIFFVSFFTVAPASIFLAGLAQDNNLLLVSFFGGIGALFGDYIIFKFIKDSFSDLLSENSRIIKLLRKSALRWLLPFIGALIIASPFPDELGLMLMGLSKINTKIFILLSFVLNFIGILIMGLLLRRAI